MYCKASDKKKRSTNFNNQEVRILLKLCLKYKDVLENKKTDSGVWKMKNNTWEAIYTEFNGISGKYNII